MSLAHPCRSLWLLKILKDGRRPPRLPDVEGMPAGAAPARYWRFAAP